MAFGLRTRGSKNSPLPSEFVSELLLTVKGYWQGPVAGLFGMNSKSLCLGLNQNNGGAGWAELF
jgi:hypothetical protein